MRKKSHFKRHVALVVAALLAAGAFPTPYACAETNESDAFAQEYVPNQVIVQYKSGAVTTDAPTKAEKKAAESANIAESFGETMGESSKSEGQKADNTLGQQAEILEGSLSDHYEIQDTVAFESENESGGSGNVARGGENSDAGNGNNESSTAGDNDTVGSSDGDEMVVSVVSSDKYSTETMIEKLEDNNDIEIAEPNYIVRATAEEETSASNRTSTSNTSAWNDEYLDSAWQLSGENGIYASSGWEAYEKSDTKSAKAVVVAVMDSGVDYEHEELKDHMWTKPDGLKLSGGLHGINLVTGSASNTAGSGGSEADSGSNETFGTLAGTGGSGNTANDTSETMDQYGHGTHCAGIIAASANNGKGIAGVFGADSTAGSADIEIMAVRILDASGRGSTSGVLKGFYYAVRCANLGVNINVINCSFGGYGDSAIYDSIFEEAGKAGILISAAAGNDNENVDGRLVSPANSTSEYAVTVGSVDEDGSLASYSNYGKCNVDILAPGTNILSSVSYYNYMPWRYSAEKVKETTEYYGEFDENSVLAEDENGVAVTPSAGSDAAGTDIEGVKQFGAGKLVTGLTAGSKATAKLSIDTSESGKLEAAKQESALRLRIENAKAGDRFVLYFPYEKNKEASKGNTYSTVLHRVQCGDADGVYVCGDVGVQLDETGSLTDVQLSNKYSAEKYYSKADAIRNSLWRDANDTDAMLAPEEKKDGYEYGLGMVFEAKDSGDFTIDIGAIAVSKPVTGNESDTTLESESAFGKYALYSGTSMAAPIVTGTIALIAAMNPNADAKEIKALLYQTTRSTDSGKDTVSTGSEVDFREYTSPIESGKPSITDATVNDEADTVTLQGLHFGNQGDEGKFVLTAKSTSTGEEKEISAEDVSRNGTKLTIRNASSYKLSGNEITFGLENSKGKTEATFYLVKGKKRYTEDFNLTYKDGETTSTKDVGGKITISDGDGAAEVSMEDIRWISNDMKILGQSTTDGELYTVEQKGVRHVGNYIYDTVMTYAEKMAASKDRETARQWSLEDEENFEIQAVSNATYYGGNVYELISCNLGTERITYMLLGMDVSSSSPKWKIYSDSIINFGNVPEPATRCTEAGMTLGNIDGKLYAIGGYGTQGDGDAVKQEAFSETWSCTVKSGATWTKEADIPSRIDNVSIDGVYRGTAIQYGDKLYYVLGRTGNGVNYSVLEFDGKNWSIAGTLPKAKKTMPIGIVTGGDNTETAVSAAVGTDRRGILIGGASTDGHGDTYRFSISDGKVEALNYTLWNNIQATSVSGLSVGSKFYALRMGENQDGDYEIAACSIPINSSYVKLSVKKSGLGSGTVTGVTGILAGRKATVNITPGAGSYIYSYSVSGYGISRKYAKLTSTGRKAQSLTLTADKDGNVSVNFGKAVTKVKLNKTGLTLKRKKSYRLRATVTGTDTGVIWKVSNKKYASVSSSGKVTIKKKAKKGKKVKVTAYSRENSKIRATCTIKIK